MSKPENLRDKLRAKTVGSKKTFRSKIVEFDGVDFEIREPTVADAHEILRKGYPDGKIEKGVLPNTGELHVWALILCTYVPGTEEKVYEVGDLESLKAAPASSFVTTLGSAAYAYIAPTKKSEPSPKKK
jgi:hypothetical protein